MRLDIRLDLSLTVPEQDPSPAAWQVRDPLEEISEALARSFDSMSLYRSRRREPYPSRRREPRTPVCLVALDAMARARRLPRLFNHDIFAT